MNIKHVYETAARFGINAAAEDIACRAASKIAEVKILKGISLTMESVDPAFLAEDAGYRWGFLDAAALHGALVRGAPLPMDAAFVDEAILAGDRCYGALDGDTIVAYGWYSSRPTAVTAIADDVILHFDRSYSYMYRGYTVPEYRGKRLHGIGMARAMEALVQSGSAGLVSVVDSGNFASLASCYRLGYRSFGQIFVARVAGRCFTHETRGCEAYDLRLEQARRPTRSAPPIWHTLALSPSK